MILKVQQLTMDAGSEKSPAAWVDRSARYWNMLLTCQQNNDGCIFTSVAVYLIAESPPPHGGWMHSSLSDEGETKDLQNKHLTRSSVEFFTQPEFNVFHNCLQHAYHHPRAPGNFSDERKSLF